MEPLKFLMAKNLVETTLDFGNPWEFLIDPADNPMKKLPKAQRRKELLDPQTEWNVYTSVLGQSQHQRISKDNPVGSMNGLVADYDMKSDLPTVMKYISQKPEQYQPNKCEVSLSDKIRLVWLFERPILIANQAVYEAFVEQLHKDLGVPTLLAGYDPASAKATEMWTNGGEWHPVREKPLSWDYLFGVMCKATQKTSLFDQGEIPLETIAKEVEAKFPGRWKNDFKLDGLGVRFWDPKADCPSGCQVKPDGMLCFTGNTGFMKWEQIFGKQWCEEQRALNLGRAGEGIYFDGTLYWEQRAGAWKSMSRVDCILCLKNRGLSDKVARGQTQSDVERVLRHIQVVNAVTAAAPMVGYPSGVVDVHGEKILNIANLHPVQPVKGPTGTTADFPWLWGFLTGFFARPEGKPLDYFLCWLRRAHQMILFNKDQLGQVIFICGPKNNGKTLLAMRIIRALLGWKAGNPTDYLLGHTAFNNDLLETGCLCVNDDECPSNEAQRHRFVAKIKSFAVNPQQRFAAKFQKGALVDWRGRVVVTLNDNPGSTGMLTEVASDNNDKQMFFASQPYKGVFPPSEELHAILDHELPHFSWWLLNAYTPPDSILTNDRMGVKSYYDPHILELANQQTFSSNLGEILDIWKESDAYWNDNTEWTGGPSFLLSTLQTCPLTQGLAREWSQYKIKKSLLSLAGQGLHGVSQINGKTFRIAKSDAPQANTTS